ncbi:FtsB family cell division protein [Thiomicrorhabdus aquaedulcis]|uniref:FtsB family cell division protein n=1 Tax=Thiomicrorhabdus aquaedulcis TaxID=2211106 RepID=UPI0022B2A054|nr:septum formation initiator family protein [Thiomicrorhabdus aquaedulcis]
MLQVRLLSSDGGVGELLALQEQLKRLETSLENQRLVNAQLEIHVKDLQTQTAAVETIARQTLGMVKKNEVFINVIELQAGSNELSETPSSAETID